MRFLSVRRRKLGVAIPTNQLRKMQPLDGDIQTSERHSESLGRSTISAWIFSSGPGPDIFLRLLDVKIIGMAQGGVNITGVVEVDDVLKRTDERAGDLATDADQSRGRGATCEQAYTALTEIGGQHGRLAGEDGGG